MKIAHLVENYFPDVGGMPEVVRQLSENLAKENNVTIYTSHNSKRKSYKYNDVNIREYKLSGNLVKGIIGDGEKFLSDLLNSDYDVITLFAAQQWSSDLVLKNIERFKSTKTKIVFVPTGFSAFFDKEYSGYFKKMKKWIKETDANVFLSSNYRDIDFAKRNKAKNIVIIPNGAGKKEFFSNPTINIKKKLNINRNSKILLHVGSHTGLKGHKELIRIFKKLKTKNCTLVIQGNGKNLCFWRCKISALLAKLVGKDIRVTNLNRKDTISLYKNSSLFVFPSNIECSPIVLFESAASKLPFVCTNVGNSIEILGWLKGGEILPTKIDINGFSHVDIENSSAQIDKLLNNKEKLKKYSELGYKNWLNNYTWEMIAKKYEDLYRTILIK